MKPMAPGSTFHHINFRSTILVSYLLSLQSFTFCSINQTYKNITLPLSISIRSHFENNREGINNPFIALGASWCLFVQIFGGLCVVSYWIDTLILKTEGNTYNTLLHHPFLLKEKTNASSRGSRKNFWRCCQGDLRQAET